jgi:iron(III) transport system substrate-binding protein
MNLRPRVLLALAFLALCGCPASQNRVVLYSAQDREFAEGLLAKFTAQAGLPVDTKFDSEANKSVSLFKELEAEKGRPRCDVFWNNEILSTIRLQRLGMLEPYDSPSAKPFPPEARAKDHTWTAFADRARILIVNTDKVKEADRPKSLFDLTDPRWKGKVLMAQPRFGTSATQVACLFAALGPEKAKEFYHKLNENGVQLAPGNKQVAEWVGQGKSPRGEVLVGITDTDDALEEVRDKHPVAIIYPDQERAPGSGTDKPLGTLFIPNTLCILKGSPNPLGARKLVDFLLGPDVEKALAEGPSAQVPLNPEVKAKLPEGIKAPREVAAMRVDYEKAADLWKDAEAFVIKEFAP